MGNESCYSDKDFFLNFEKCHNIKLMLLKLAPQSAESKQLIFVFLLSRIEVLVHDSNWYMTEYSSALCCANAH